MLHEFVSETVSFSVPASELVGWNEKAKKKEKEEERKRTYSIRPFELLFDVRRRRRHVEANVE